MFSLNSTDNLLSYKSDGQTMAHGPYTACQWILCSLWGHIKLHSLWPVHHSLPMLC